MSQRKQSPQQLTGTIGRSGWPRKCFGPTTPDCGRSGHCVFVPLAHGGAATVVGDGGGRRRRRGRPERSGHRNRHPRGRSESLRRAADLIEELAAENCGRHRRDANAAGRPKTASRVCRLHSAGAGPRERSRRKAPSSVEGSPARRIFPAANHACSRSAAAAAPPASRARA